MPWGTEFRYGYGIVDAVFLRVCAAFTVKAVKKGTAGSAGELRGDFDLTQDIGTLSANTTSGIFGTAETCPETWNSSQALPAASASEIQEGPAQILSNVEGDTVRSYDIEILNVNCGAADGREMVISVTDPELIAATGGIVQGMSGSPFCKTGRLWVLSPMCC